MARAIRAWVQVQTDGQIVVKTPSLVAGSWAEVIVLTDDNAKDAADIAEQWARWFASVRLQPGASEIDDEVISAEIQAQRSGR